MNMAEQDRDTCSECGARLPPNPSRGRPHKTCSPACYEQRRNRRRRDARAGNSPWAEKSWPPEAQERERLYLEEFSRFARGLAP